VSRRHAELTPDGDSWLLRDLDSANGTFINGLEIHERVTLNPGDQVRCGSTLFLFTSTTDDDRRPARLRLIEPESMDVTVESTSDPNAESMILAAPDPLRAASDHLRVVYTLTALTASAVTREDLLNAVMDLIFDEFKPDRGFILLGSDPNGPLDPTVTRHAVRPKTVDEGRIPVSRTIIQHAMEKQEGVLCSNAMTDTRFRSGDSVQDYGIRSAMCVPITSGDRLFGVIHIDSQMANFTFTESQLQLMTAIAQHTGLALLSGEKIESHFQQQRLAAIGQTVASISHSIKNILQGCGAGRTQSNWPSKKRI
jgi:two-component system NtrC family sensor kinase